MQELELSSANRRVFIDFYSLTFALMSADSTQFFLITEVLPSKKKICVATDLTWEDAYRNAKKHGTLAVVLSANEAKLLESLEMTWTDYQADLTRLEQDLFDANRLDCSSFLSGNIEAYSIFNIPVGLELIESDSILDIQ